MTETGTVFLDLTSHRRFVRDLERHLIEDMLTCVLRHKERLLTSAKIEISPSCSFIQLSTFTSKRSRHQLSNKLCPLRDSSRYPSASPLTAAIMVINPHKLGVHKLLKHIPLNAIFDAPSKARLRKAVNIADLRLCAKQRAHKVRAIRLHLLSS